jgi:hypothetical protein
MGAARRFRRNTAARAVTPMFGRLDAYLCSQCAEYTVTVDVGDGKTSQAIRCPAAACAAWPEAGIAESIGRPNPWPAGVPTTPRWEWRTPNAKTMEAMRQAGGSAWDHVRAGGMLLHRRHKVSP